MHIPPLPVCHLHRIHNLRKRQRRQRHHVQSLRQPARKQRRPVRPRQNPHLRRQWPHLIQLPPVRPHPVLNNPSSHFLVHREVKRLIILRQQPFIIIFNLLFIILPLPKLQRQLRVHLRLQRINRLLPLNHIPPNFLPEMLPRPRVDDLLYILIRQNQFIFLRLHFAFLDQLSLQIQHRLYIFHRPMHRLDDHRLWHLIRTSLDHHHLTVFTSHDEVQRRLLALFRRQKRLELPANPPNPKSRNRPVKRRSRQHQSA